MVQYILTNVYIYVSTIRVKTIEIFIPQISVVLCCIQFPFLKKHSSCYSLVATYQYRSRSDLILLERNINGLVGLHRTVQLQLFQRYWSGHRCGLLWYWMVCFGNVTGMSGNFVGRIKGAKYRFDLQYLTWDFSWDTVAGKGFILRWRGSHVVFLELRRDSRVTTGNSGC